MKKPKLTQKKWNYTALAFLIPFVGMLCVMLVSQYKPFGKYSMLYSDMYHQYYPFFVAYRKALLSGDSLLYSWNVGMGMDYLGLISYYLASPLNLLSVLVPEGLLLEFFSLLMPVKLGLASMFFAIMLKKTFQRNDFSIALFGGFYGLCAWGLGYQWNIMWLDTFALLPLVALGTVSLLKEKKFVLYTVTLFLSVFANYYIGLFTCFFVFLLFFCYQICRWNGFKKFFADLFRIALFSALAIGMTAILELPALAALQTTQSSVNKFPTDFRLNIASANTWKGLLDAMRQVAGNMNGGLTPTFKEGLPNLYCGICTTILAMLFITCKEVKFRDKLCSVILLIFFNVSFIIRQLDYIWHGFHFTNMIPYRFSFLYSFVLLYMAYRAYLLRRHFRLWQIVFAGGLAIGIAAFSNDLTDSVYLAYNGAFLLLYLCTFIYAHLRKPLPKKAVQAESVEDIYQDDGSDELLTAAKEGVLDAKRKYLDDHRYRRRTGGTILFIVMSAELILNLINFGISFPGTAVSNYPNGTTYTASMIRYMKQREANTLFYRAETTHSQTLNDGALNGYNGISTFTSSANVRVTLFMQALGYGAKDTYNRYCFEESSPVSNLFLGLKYMLERDGRVEENRYFTDLHHFGNVHLLENNAYLPLGFLAETSLADVDFGDGSSHFAFQNTLFREATGQTQDVWHQLIGSALSISALDAELSSTSTTGYCNYKTAADKSGSVTYSYTSDREGFLCIDLNLPKRNSFTVSKNGTELYSESYSLPQMLAVSDVVPGDVIEIKLRCSADENSSMTVRAAVMNDACFQAGYKTLSASTLELTRFQNTLVEGTINCDRDGILYTSIPQNGNWSATVDGEPAEITLVGNAMIGLQLSEGYHTVRFTYRNGAFCLGWKVSLGCFAVFVILYLIIYQPKVKKGKFQKR